MYSGIRTAHPIIDASSSTTPRGSPDRMVGADFLPRQTSAQDSWCRQRSFSPRHRHGGMWPPLPPPLPPSTPPTPLNILSGLSSIISMTFGKTPNASASILYGKGTASSGNRTPDSWAKGQHVGSELWLSLGSLCLIIYMDLEVPGEVMKQTLNSIVQSDG